MEDSNIDDYDKTLKSLNPIPEGNEETIDENSRRSMIEAALIQSHEIK